MFLLPFASLIVVRQVKADVRVISVFLEWARHNRPPVRRRVVDGQNGPPAKLLGAITSLMSSLDRDARHLRPLLEIQSVDGDPVFSKTYQERLWDVPWLSCFPGSLPRIHASTELLFLGQVRKTFSQWTERGAILPVRGAGSKGNLVAVSRRRRAAGAGSFRPPTSSCPRPHRCSARSGARPRQPAI